MATKWIVTLCNSSLPLGDRLLLVLQHMDELTVVRTLRLPSPTTACEIGEEIQHLSSFSSGKCSKIKETCVSLPGLEDFYFIPAFNLLIIVHKFMKFTFLSCSREESDQGHRINLLPGSNHNSGTSQGRPQVNWTTWLWVMYCLDPITFLFSGIEYYKRWLFNNNTNVMWRKTII